MAENIEHVSGIKFPELDEIDPGKMSLTHPSWYFDDGESHFGT